MRIETWTSDKGNEELHHFTNDNTPDVYLFGFNRKFLGEETYEVIRFLIELRMKQINEGTK